MTDARYPAAWLMDPTLQRLSDRAHRGFVLALAWAVSARTDGIIRFDDLDLIPGFPRGVEEELAKAEVWAVLDEGWLIVWFALTQTSRAEFEQLDHARLKAREKKARQRAKAAAGQTDVPGDSPPGQTPGQSPGTSPGTTQARQGKAEPCLATNETDPLTAAPISSKAVPKSGTSPARVRAKGGTRGTRLPEGWEPPESDIRAMHEQFPWVNLRAEHEKFCDYWRGLAGQRATKVDWIATWRNWMRRAAEETPQRNGHAITRTEEKTLGWMAMGRQQPEQLKGISS